MSAPLRVLLVGAGAIAHTHVAAIAASKRVALAAVVDPALERALALAATAGVPAYRSLAEVPASLDAEIAIVCTPPSTHEALVIALLERGLHVLCEKPFALTG
jgi:predicted dehydrogenase